MPFIVEDGTNVTGANSFVSVADARDYADLRGLLLPVDDSELETYLILGTDYLNSRREEYKGCMTYDDQPLSWPRKNVILYEDVEQPEDEIPTELIAALVNLAALQTAGLLLYPTPLSPLEQSGVYVSEETIGPLVTKFNEYKHNPVSTVSPIYSSAVEALLKPLLSGFAGQFGSIRV